MAGMLGVIVLAMYGDRTPFYQDPYTYHQSYTKLTPLGQVCGASQSRPRPRLTTMLIQKQTIAGTGSATRLVPQGALFESRSAELHPGCAERRH